MYRTLAGPRTRNTIVPQYIQKWTHKFYSLVLLFLSISTRYYCHFVGDAPFSIPLPPPPPPPPGPSAGIGLGYVHLATSSSPIYLLSNHWIIQLHVVQNKANFSIEKIWRTRASYLKEYVHETDKKNWVCLWKFVDKRSCLPLTITTKLY